MPSLKEVKEKFGKLLNAKKYEDAAKLAVYYAFAKMDPDEIARKLVEGAEKWQKEKEKREL